MVNFIGSTTESKVRSDVQEVADGLESIQGVSLVGVDNTVAADTIVQWQNHDPDPQFESALSIARNDGRLREMTVRFGAVGTYDILPQDEMTALEADWVDVVLDSWSSTGKKIDFDMVETDIGDMYISEYARPHMRLHRKEEGYSITTGELIEFLKELNQRHKRKFGTLEDRLMEPRYSDILELR